MFFEICFYIFLQLHAIFDAARDGWVFDNLYDDHTVSFVTIDNWHLTKTLSRISLLCTGLCMAQMDLNFLLIIKMLSGCMIALVLWRLTYHKVRYQTFLKLDARANQNALLLPIPFKGDITIALSGKQVIVFYIITACAGLTGIIITLG